MQTNHFEFALYLAEDELKRKYGRGKEAYELLGFSPEPKGLVSGYCRNLLSSGNARMAYAKLMKMEWNRRAVAAAVQSLPQEKQRYLLLKYQKEKGVFAISLALSVSVAQLNLWHQGILAQVSRFMLYTLRPDDVFYRARVTAMVKLLADALNYFPKLDSEGVMITAAWLSAIAARLEKYRMVLGEIDSALERRPASLYDSILAMRLAHPYETTAFVADACHADVASVSRCLRKFRDEMSHCLM